MLMVQNPITKLYNKLKAILKEPKSYITLKYLFNNWLKTVNKAYIRIRIFIANKNFAKALPTKALSYYDIFRVSTSKANNKK